MSADFARMSWSCWQAKASCLLSLMIFYALGRGASTYLILVLQAVDLRLVLHEDVALGLKRRGERRGEVGELRRHLGGDGGGELGRHAGRQLGGEGHRERRRERHLGGQGEEADPRASGAAAGHTSAR